MAAAMEIKGSGRTWIRGNQRFGEKLLVYVTGDTGIPARGDAYDGGGASDTGNSARKCFNVEIHPEEPFPGLFFVQATYGNFIAYS